MKDSPGTLTQISHYTDIALQLFQPLVFGQTYKSAEDSSQDTTPYVASSDITSLTVSK